MKNYVRKVLDLNASSDLKMLLIQLPYSTKSKDGYAFSDVLKGIGRGESLAYFIGNEITALDIGRVSKNGHHFTITDKALCTALDEVNKDALETKYTGGKGFPVTRKTTPASVNQADSSPDRIKSAEARER